LPSLCLPLVIFVHQLEMLVEELATIATLGKVA
jgi:hypothetical protein